MSTTVIQHVPVGALPASPLEGTRIKMAEAMVRTTLRGEMFLHIGRVPTDVELDRAIAAIDAGTYKTLVDKFASC